MHGRTTNLPDDHPGTNDGCPNFYRPPWEVKQARSDERTCSLSVDLIAQLPRLPAQHGPPAGTYRYRSWAGTFDT